ncbi:hypothetical protein H4R34_003756 [Dimargaris verticillata]|uniref:Uncharacterized protein n=1 Tax=Dimargaris verticillata TaxID=2761393 RepID=A0A9W8ECV2_9FUNG|nr:hypothetical protein H4R34_003756 [Dimargaris verticillata]
MASSTTEIIERLTSSTLTATATETGGPDDYPTIFYNLTTPGMLTTISIVLLMIVILAVAIMSLMSVETPTGLKQQKAAGVQKKAQ